MKDAEYEAFVAKVQGYFDKWLVILGLGDWRLVYPFYHGPIPNSEASMDCSAKWEYKSATISISAAENADWPDTRLEWNAVHELMHCLTMPLADQADENCPAARMLVERVVTDLTNAVLWAYKAGQEAAEKKEPA